VSRLLVVVEHDCVPAEYGLDEAVGVTDGRGRGLVGEDG